MRSLHEAGEAGRDLLAGRRAVQSAAPDVGLVAGPLALLRSPGGADPDSRAGTPAGGHPADDGDPLDHRGAAAGGDGAHRAGAGGHPAGRAGARRLRAVCRSDHLSLHRQLHAGRGDVRPRPRSADRVRRVVVARGRRQPHADPARLRGGRDRHLDVDQQHRDDRDDVSDRAVDRRAPDRRAASPSWRAATSPPR